MRVCVCICVHLCAILRTSFSVLHADCASYCARVQTIKVRIGTLSVSLHLYFSLPPPFSIFLSALLFLLPVWHFCRPYTTSLNFLWAYHLLDFNQGRLSFFPLQIEKKKKNSTFQKKKVLLRNNFWLHAALTPCVINGKPNHLPRFGCKCMFCCFLLRIRQSKLAWCFTVSIH